MFGLETMKININTWKSDLHKLLNDVDGDLTGINGDDNLLEEAKEKNFDNNLDYFMSKFEVEKLCDLDKVLDYLRDEYFLGMASDYFTHFDMRYMYELDKDRASTGNVFIAIAYAC